MIRRAIWWFVTFLVAAYLAGVAAMLTVEPPFVLEKGLRIREEYDLSMIFILAAFPFAYVVFMLTLPLILVDKLLLRGRANNVLCNVVAWVLLCIVSWPVFALINNNGDLTNFYFDPDVIYVSLVAGTVGGAAFFVLRKRFPFQW
jgi:hypothetical protein